MNKMIMMMAVLAMSGVNEKIYAKKPKGPSESPLQTANYDTLLADNKKIEEDESKPKFNQDTSSTFLNLKRDVRDIGEVEVDLAYNKDPKLDIKNTIRFDKNHDAENYDRAKTYDLNHKNKPVSDVKHIKSTIEYDKNYNKYNDEVLYGGNLYESKIGTDITINTLNDNYTLANEQKKVKYDLKKAKAEERLDKLQQEAEQIVSKKKKNLNEIKNQYRNKQIRRTEERGEHFASHHNKAEDAAFVAGDSYYDPKLGRFEEKELKKNQELQEIVAQTIKKEEKDSDKLRSKTKVLFKKEGKTTKRADTEYSVVDAVLLEPNPSQEKKQGKEKKKLEDKEKEYRDLNQLEKQRREERMLSVEEEARQESKQSGDGVESKDRH